MELIFQASNILEAHIIVGLLQSNDIPCHVSGHYLQGAVGDLPAGDFAHVILDDVEKRELAKKLIKAYETNQL